MASTEKDGSDSNSADIYQLAGETSLHGIRYVGNTNISTFRRFVWATFVIGAISVLIFAVCSAVLKYYEHNFASAISLTQNAEINFPAITFCNHNNFQESLMTDEDKYFFNNLHNKTFDFTPYNEVNYTAMLLRLGHKIEDMLLECKWKSEYCQANNFSTSILDFGVCYTFNGDSRKPLTTANAGYTSGLQLKLDINQTAHIYSQYGTAGIKMLIHGQGEYPVVNTFGFSLVPGLNTDIPINAVKFVSLPHPFKSNCTTKSLKYSETYTQQQCVNECKYQFIADRCGCKHPTMYADVPLCSAEKMVRCAYVQEEKFFSSNVPCDCPIGCQRMIYKKKLSTSIWPANYALPAMTKTYGKTSEYIRDNFLSVNIYFEDINFVENVEVRAYSGLQLLSEIGGYMGILCGMSIITILEFIEFGFISAVFRFSRKK